MKEFLPFKLDTVNQCLLRRTDTGNDERILVTPKAYGVLQYLVEHAGRLVTQDELLGALWPRAYVQPEVLKHHILEVRKALGDRPKNPLFIETLPRRGYRFIAPISAGPVTDHAAAAKSAHGRLVGRDGALAALRDCLGWASRGQQQIVFVTGESGIGKTALVDEFQRLAAAEAPGLRVALGQCVEGFGSKEAYYPMLEALGQLCRGPRGGEIINILAARAPTWLVQFPALLKREHRETLQREILGATRERMLREIGEALATITADHPLLLVFEDLQWVDHATVDLLSALARRRSPVRMMLIGNYRPVDLALAEHPLKTLKQELLAHQLCQETALDPLSEAEVAEYLAAESEGGSPPAGLAKFVYRHSEGNPLFMVATLEHMSNRGLVSHEGGKWHLRVPLDEIELGVPEGLRKLMEAQIERLSEEEQRALGLASIVGSAFSANVAVAANGLEPEEFEDLCDHLSRRHRIVRAVDSRQFPDGSVSAQYEFTHALYREVLYGQQAFGRRAKRHALIGERLEVLHGKALGEIAAELAHHFEEGLDWPRAVTYLQLAAETAGRRYAHREATAILRRALELTRKLPDTQQAARETGILERLATIYAASFDMRALETYEALLARAAHHGLNDVEVRALFDMAFFLSWISSQRCLDVVERALRLSSGKADSNLQASTRVTYFYWRIMAGGWNAQHADDCRNALAEIRRADDPLVQAMHQIDYSFIQWTSSAYREAQRSAAESRAILFEGREEITYLCRQFWASQVISSWSLMFLGEWGKALSESEAAITMLARNGDDHRAQKSRLYRAWVLLHAADYAGVLTICESVFPLVERDPARIYALRLCLVLAGSAEVALENHDRAFERLSAASDEMNRQTVTFDWYWRMQLELGLTELWLSKGDLSQARTQAERFLDTTLATAERTWQALAWEANARVALAELRTEHALKCIAQALSTIQGFEAPLAAWRVHATAAELHACAKNRDLAEHYRNLSQATILKLANSLPKDEPPRNTFLSSRLVAKIVGETYTVADPRVENADAVDIKERGTIVNREQDASSSPRFMPSCRFEQTF